MPISLKYKIWLTSDKGEGILGDGRWQLLSSIEKLGSLKAAADSMGISYRKAWGDLKSAEEKMGCTLIEKQRGGKEGGNTVLTTMGEKLIRAYAEFHLHVEASIKEAFVEFTNNLGSE